MAENTVPTTTETPTAATREESRYLVPPVDIYETEEGLVVLADLPGVEKDEVDVRVEDDLLTIDAKPHDGLPGSPVLEEFRLRNFHRQFRLGEQIDQERIGANLTGGVLTIDLPKAAKARPKAIAVSVG